MNDAHRSDLPDPVNPPQDRPVVARFDRLNCSLSPKRTLRPSRSRPFLGAHLEDDKLSVQRRFIAVYVNDVVMRCMVAPAPRRCGFIICDTAAAIASRPTTSPIGSDFPELL
jgi:hypothetical protein